MPRHSTRNTHGVRVSAGDGGGGGSAPRSESRSRGTRTYEHVSSRTTRAGGGSSLMHSNNQNYENEVPSSSSSLRRPHPVMTVADPFINPASMEMRRGVQTQQLRNVNHTHYTPRIYQSFNDLQNQSPDFFATRPNETNERTARVEQHRSMPVLVQASSTVPFAHSQQPRAQQHQQLPMQSYTVPHANSNVGTMGYTRLMPPVSYSQLVNTRSVPQQHRMPQQLAPFTSNFTYAAQQPPQQQHSIPAAPLRTPVQMHPPPVYNHIRFVTLNSYEVVKELLRVKHVRDGEQYTHAAIRHKEPNYNSFSLSELPQRDLAEYKIMLRFCKVPPGLKPTIHSPIEQQDALPKSFHLTINNSAYSVKNKYTYSPYDITARVTGEHSNEVSLLVKLEAGEPFAEQYYFGLFLVKRVDHQQLISALKVKATADKELTFQIVRKKLIQDPDVLIAEQENEIIVSLNCPLSSRRLETPVRSIQCEHVACFDATAFIQINAMTPRWRCPHCQKYLRYQDLIVDGVVSEMIAQAPPNCTRGSIREDCSWVFDNSGSSKTSTQVPSSAKKEQSGTKGREASIKTEEPEGSIKQVISSTRSNGGHEIECIDISDSSDEGEYESDPVLINNFVFDEDNGLVDDEVNPDEHNRSREIEQDEMIVGNGNIRSVTVNVKVNVENAATGNIDDSTTEEADEEFDRSVTEAEAAASRVTLSLMENGSTTEEEEEVEGDAFVAVTQENEATEPPLPNGDAQSDSDIEILFEGPPSRVKALKRRRTALNSSCENSVLDKPNEMKRDDGTDTEDEHREPTNAASKRSTRSNSSSRSNGDGSGGDSERRRKRTRQRRNSSSSGSGHRRGNSSDHHHHTPDHSGGEPGGSETRTSCASSSTLASSASNFSTFTTTDSATITSVEVTTTPALTATTTTEDEELPAASGSVVNDEDSFSNQVIDDWLNDTFTMATTSETITTATMALSMPSMPSMASLLSDFEQQQQSNTSMQQPLAAFQRSYSATYASVMNSFKLPPQTFEKISPANPKPRASVIARLRGSHFGEGDGGLNNQTLSLGASCGVGNMDLDFYGPRPDVYRHPAQNVNPAQLDAHSERFLSHATQLQTAVQTSRNMYGEQDVGRYQRKIPPVNFAGTHRSLSVSTSGYTDVAFNVQQQQRQMHQAHHLHQQQQQAQQLLLQQQQHSPGYLDSTDFDDIIDTIGQGPLPVANFGQAPAPTIVNTSDYNLWLQHQRKKYVQQQQQQVLQRPPPVDIPMQMMMHSPPFSQQEQYNRHQRPSTSHLLSQQQQQQLYVQRQQQQQFLQNRMSPMINSPANSLSPSSPYSIFEK